MGTGRTIGALVGGALLAAGLWPAAAEADTKSLPLTDFVALDLANGIKAVVVPGEAISVTAQSPRSGDIDDLKTSVSGGVLKAWFDWSIWHLLDFSGRDLTLQITMPELDGVAVSGGSSVAATSVPSDDLKIDASGGARATINAASAKRYTIGLSGGAAVGVSGTCYSAAVNVSGGAALEAKDLICADVQANVSGGAHAKITATAGITADASGGSVLTIYGNPASTQVNSSGGGKIDFSN
jgi:putative autotransporter adhesin-like protein